MTKMTTWETGEVYQMRTNIVIHFKTGGFHDEEFNTIDDAARAAIELGRDCAILTGGPEGFLGQYSTERGLEIW